MPPTAGCVVSRHRHHGLTSGPNFLAYNITTQVIGKEVCNTIFGTGKRASWVEIHKSQSVTIKEEVEK